MKNILLIDDDEDEINIFNEALERAGIVCNCKWANNSRHVLQVNPLPDIIFLDINMPCVNGFECLADIKKSPLLLSIPVILYSTGMTGDLCRKGLLLGAAACIAKTYSINDLVNILKRLFSMQPGFNATIHA